MLNSWHKKGRGPIGVDIGSRCIRLLQFEQKNDGCHVVDAAMVELDPALGSDGPTRDQAVGAAIEQLLNSHHFVGRHVVSSLPAQWVTYKNVRVPRMPANELEEAVKWEAADRLHLSSDSMSLQFFNAGEVRQGEDVQQEVILLAVDHQAIDRHVDILLGCGLTPHAVEVAPSALARWAQFHQADNESAEADVILDLGYTTSKILICRHGRVLFYKQLDVGGRQINERLSQQMKLPVEDICKLRIEHQVALSSEMPSDESMLVGSTHQAGFERVLSDAIREPAADLAREIGLCLRYFSVTFRGRRPETAWVTGGEGYEPLLRQLIGEGAGVELHMAPALNEIHCESALLLKEASSLHSPWAVAAGLAMRQPDAKAQKVAA